MSGPTLAELLVGMLAARAHAEAVFDALEQITPEVLKGPEDVLRQAIVTALAPLDLPAVLASLESAAKVVKEGRGVVGDGFDANLA